MAVSPVARPDYAAHIRAVRSSFPEVVIALREILGLKLCAYLGSVKETRAVNEWADGVREPSEAVQRRLRLAFQVAGAIAEVDGAEVARAWFQGLAPPLVARSPDGLARAGGLERGGPEASGGEGAARVG